MTEEKQKLKLVNELLAIKKEKELYKFVIQQKPDVVVDLLFLLPQKKFKYAAFLVFAMCDYLAKIDQEEPLLYFVSLLSDRSKRDPKFRKQINMTLNYMIQDEGRPKFKDTEEIKPPVKSIEETPLESSKDSEE